MGAVRVAAFAVVALTIGCQEQPRANTANGPAPCCVSSTSAKPSASAVAVGSVDDAWTSLLAAMRAGDDVAIARWTTPAGLASLRAGVHGEPEHTAFARWGAGWAKWELRWKLKSGDRATAALGPEAKEHGLEFVRTPTGDGATGDGGWKLERWSPGE